MRFNKCLLISTMTLFWGDLLWAQSKQAATDFTHTIEKYNSAFKGTGPEVYFLPKPRSKQELLIDQFEEKKQFSKTIISEFQFQRMLEGLSRNWLADPELAQLQQKGIEQIKIKNFSEALQLFKKASFAAEQQQLPKDRLLAKYLEANTLLYTQEYAQSEFAFNEVINLAIKDKNAVLQADAFVGLAYIKAEQFLFEQAHQLIIRKAIPLYNRAKESQKKILAWEHLAIIYQMEKKYTEAQWFLLQARQLAEQKNFPEELAEIEYLLALSKFNDQSFKVSRNEFLSARKLALAENNKLLTLAIVDKLGEVQLHLQEFQEAENSFKEYEKLKKELFQ